MKENEEIMKIAKECNILRGKILEYSDTIKNIEFKFCNKCNCKINMKLYDEETKMCIRCKNLNESGVTDEVIKEVIENMVDKINDYNYKHKYDNPIKVDWIDEQDSKDECYPVTMQKDIDKYYNGIVEVFKTRGQIIKEKKRE